MPILSRFYPHNDIVSMRIHAKCSDLFSISIIGIISTFPYDADTLSPIGLQSYRFTHPLALLSYLSLSPAQETYNVRLRALGKRSSGIHTRIFICLNRVT